MIGEVELAARFLKGHIVAITGSNGKTTTTTLAGEILSAGGRKTLVGGNIGTPAITFVDQSTDDTWVVLEISSFQLETVETFHPHIAVVLNITPDHLDRHHTFENYAAAKARIFENQTAEDFAVLNADNEACADAAAEGQASGAVVQPFERSRQRSVRARRSRLSGAMRRATAKSCRSARSRSKARTTWRMCWRRYASACWLESSRRRFAVLSPLSKR